MPKSVEPAIVDVLTRVAMQEDPHVDDLLVSMLQTVDTGAVTDSVGERSAGPVELLHARALIEAFALQLELDGDSRRRWRVSPYGASLSDRFGPPGPLADVQATSVDVWELYMHADLPPFVLAHLSDLVANARRGLPGSADTAIASLLALPGAVPDVYASDHLARALELVALFGRRESQSVVEDALLGQADLALADPPGLGTFVTAVKALADRGVRPHEVGDLLDRAVDVWAGNSHALTATHELRRQTALDSDARTTAERDHAQCLLDEAGSEPHGIRRLVLLQEAHAVADRYGHADLARQAQTAMRGIPPESFGFQHFSVESPISPEWFDGQVTAIVGRDDLPAALRRCISTCPTGEVEEVRARAEAGEGVGTFASLLGTVVLNAERLPQRLHSGGDVDAAMATLQEIHLGLYLPILARSLGQLGRSYDIGDPRLADQLAVMGDLPFRKAAKLVRCLRRFWRGDYEGASYVGATLVEGILRERLVAAGEEPYQLPRSDGTKVGKYKTLGQLISMAHASGLDGSWSAYLAYTLADPSHGPNLRNELLHGAVDEDPGPLDATAVLIAALYLALGSTSLAPHVP